MIKVYYSICSDSVDQELRPGVSRLLERYVTILDYDNIFKDWIQKPNETDPLIVTGSKGKVAVVQVVLDVRSVTELSRIIISESNASFMTKISRKIISMFPLRTITKVLNKFNLLDDISANLVLGKISFVVLNSEDFRDLNLDTDKIRKLMSLGWYNFCIVDKDKGIVVLWCKDLPKAVIIPLREVESLVPIANVNFSNVVSGLHASYEHKAKVIANYMYVV